MSRKSAFWFVAAVMVVGGIGLAPRSEPAVGQVKNDAAVAQKKDDDAKKPVLQTFMRRKLEASQKILEGLAVEDFDMIALGARQLRGISAAAEFAVSKDVLYIQHADEFRRIADRLEKVAKEKRLDASALSYMDLTLNCIECHRFVRNILVAQ
jgi:hypothetical protein